MSIVNHPDWDLSERGKKDAERHRKKIDDAIRDNVKDVIAEESIITNRKGKKVKVPVKGLKDYKFIHGGPKKQGSGDGEGDGEGEGAGQGKGKPGDIIGRKPKEGQGPGQGQKPGNDPGEDYIETEVDIDYLVEIMFEDLGLPWIEEKQKASQLVPTGWKFETITKKGILPRIHKNRTMIEAIKQNQLHAKEIEEETGCEHEDALKALVQGAGDINSAIEIIQKGNLDTNIEPYVIIEDANLRYKQIEEDYTLHSNAVVIAMMDVSGSMDNDKKYLCRSLLFWLVEFLKRAYDFVDIKFITHTTEAKLVDEETFFHKGESGGTYCWSAIDKAIYLVDTEYPPNEWNVYCIYVSDGEDWEAAKSVAYVEELLKRNIAMFSYNEVKPNSPYAAAWAGTASTLLKEMREKWKFVSNFSDGAEFYKNEDLHFLLSVLKDKKHIYPCLKHILFKEDK